jgi:hypothetical protein
MKTFISGLSKPFRHLDKYPSTLQELERNMEVVLLLFNNEIVVRMDIRIEATFNVHVQFIVI